MNPDRAYGHSDDKPLAELAAKQHGIVCVAQCHELGYSNHAIHRRAATGRLHRLYRGVYAVGHTRITVRGRWMAAVLACGTGAVLSHRAAAALWELAPNPTGRLDVTARSRHHIEGLTVHITRELHAHDRTTIDGIPVTSVSRTLLDRAETLHPQRLRTMLEVVQRRDLLNPGHISAMLQRSPGRRGVTPLQQAVASLTDEAPWTQSQLEQRFLELVREAGIPEPQANVVVAGEIVDFYWPESKLVVELDSWGFHKTRAHFEDDRRRDAKLQVAGYRGVRFTYTMVSRAPRALQRDLRTLLGL